MFQVKNYTKIIRINGTNATPTKASFHPVAMDHMIPIDNIAIKLEAIITNSDTKLLKSLASFISKAVNSDGFVVFESKYDNSCSFNFLKTNFLRLTIHFSLAKDIVNSDK